jgi:hypothetical protein
VYIDVSLRVLSKDSVMTALQQGDSAIIVNEHCDRIILNPQTLGPGRRRLSPAA